MVGILNSTYDPFSPLLRAPQARAFPSVQPEIDQAQEAELARQAAAFRLARGVMGTERAIDRFGADNVPQEVLPLNRFANNPPPPPAFGFTIGQTPWYEQTGQPSASPAPPLPAPIEVKPTPTDKVASVPGAPTDISSSSRAPLALAPPMPAAAPSPAAPAVEPPSVFDRLSNGLAANPMTLMTLGAGIAQGGIGKGLQSAIAGAQADRVNNRDAAMRSATAQALRARGASDADIAMAVASPDAMKALLSRLWPTYKFGMAGDTMVRQNEADGTVAPVYQGSKIERMSPGDNLVQVGGGVPGQQPAGARVIATGGPEKPSAGFKYADPNDPSKGLVAIPGGPATQLSSEVAGRLAMMETAAADLPAARKTLMDGRGGAGTGIGGVAASTLNVGETGRAQRTVRLAIEGALRAMTGAAAPETEVANYMNLFMPSPFDSRETAAQKMNALDEFISRAGGLVRQGRTSTPTESGGAAPPRRTDPLGVR